MRKLIFSFFCLLMLTACYQQDKSSLNDLEMTPQQRDSANFFNVHHYAHDYNFRVKADSLTLIVVPNPAEIVSTNVVDVAKVVSGDRLVVGAFVIIPGDSIDSVWVQVLRDENTIGWIHEKELLAGTRPNNPISMFIDVFSNTHLLIFLVFLVLVGALYGVRRYRKLGIRLVHFNDVGSFYPTLLTLLVSSSAVFYSTIQMQDAESWSHFYYHPTLNPFTVPLHLCIFLCSVWAIVIVSLATLLSLHKHLTPSQQLVYYLGLMGVCAVDYVVFSLSTLIYVGYPLLVVYIGFALWRYFRYGRMRYACGNCGRPLRDKGICPHCGAENV